MFIAVALAAFRAASIVVTVPIAPARLAAAYLIGTTSTVWLIEQFSRLLWDLRDVRLWHLADILSCNPKCPLSGVKQT